MKTVQYSVSSEHEKKFDDFVVRVFPWKYRGNKKKTVEALIMYAAEKIDAQELRDFYYEKVGL